MLEGMQELESQVCFINYVIEEEVERILVKTEQELAPKCREIFKTCHGREKITRRSPVVGSFREYGENAEKDRL